MNFTVERDIIKNNTFDIKNGHTQAWEVTKTTMLLFSLADVALLCAVPIIAYLTGVNFWLTFLIWLFLITGQSIYLTLLYLDRSIPETIARTTQTEELAIVPAINGPKTPYEKKLALELKALVLRAYRQTPAIARNARECAFSEELGAKISAERQNELYKQYLEPFGILYLDNAGWRLADYNSEDELLEDLITSLETLYAFAED